MPNREEFPVREPFRLARMPDLDNRAAATIRAGRIWTSLVALINCDALSRLAGDATVGGFLVRDLVVLPADVLYVLDR